MTDDSSAGEDVTSEQEQSGDICRIYEYAGDLDYLKQSTDRYI